MSKSLLLTLASIPEREYSEAEFKRLVGFKDLTPFSHLIPTTSNGIIDWTMHNRLSAAVEAIRAGAHVEEVAKTLGWKAFEGITEAVFRAWDYRTKRNIRKDGKEIDLYAEGRSLAFTVECKRWRRSAGEISMGKVGQTLLEKAQCMAREKVNSIAVIPLIVTLQRYTPRIVNGIPIVPIGTLQNFLENLDQYLPHLKKIWGRLRRAKTI